MLSCFTIGVRKRGDHVACVVCARECHTITIIMGVTIQLSCMMLNGRDTLELSFVCVRHVLEYLQFRERHCSTIEGNHFSCLGISEAGKISKVTINLARRRCGLERIECDFIKCGGCVTITQGFHVALGPVTEELHTIQPLVLRSDCLML